MSAGIAQYLADKDDKLQLSAVGRGFVNAKRALGIPPPAGPVKNPPDPPPPPLNAKQKRAATVAQVAAGLQILAQLPGIIAEIKDPVAAVKGVLIGKAADALDSKIAGLTNGLSAMLPNFPAASLMSLAVGLPHAHIKHPPSGPPPIPPIPLPPLGPIMLGTALTVLINGKPAARCGDYGINPTCCGIVPPTSAMYEIFTGSSKVFIAGNRAARMIDITFHCKKAAPKVKTPPLSKMQKLGAAASKVAGVASQVGQVASAAAAAEAEDDAAMSAAMGLSTAMMAAQMAADAITAALTKMIGTDQATIPPTGTPGMIVMGSPNVLIGGIPMPSSTAIINGLMKKIKGLKGGKGASPAAAPAPPATEGTPPCPNSPPAPSN